jgi:polar amino acid transport system substrate-binding protein
MNIQNLKPLLPPVTNENLYLTISHNHLATRRKCVGGSQKALYKLEKQSLMNKLVSSNIQLWRKQQAK